MNEPLEVILQFEQQTSSVAGDDDEGDEHYHVAVVQAPGSGWGGPVAGNELETGEIETIRSLYRGFVARQNELGTPLDERLTHTLRIIGDKLYQSFPETVQARLDEAIAIARAQNRALQLTLAFEPSAEALLVLPWELLHHADGRFFFALQGGGVVRQISLPPQWHTLADFRPHNILGLWAEPTGIAPLTARRTSGPSPEQPGAIQWRQGANTLSQLQTALAEGGFDALHLVAHGRLGSNWGTFSLALADENGQTQWVSGEQLTTLLQQYPALRFVYLDVCGGDPVTAGIQPAGLARQLLGMGLSGVVLMQDVMGQSASGVAAQAFYQALGRGESAATAVTHARVVIRLQQDDIVNWSIPTLYQPPHPPRQQKLWADVVLDRIMPNENLPLMFPLMGLLLLISYLSNQLTQITLHEVSSWRTLPALLVGTTLISLVTAVVTRQDQTLLGLKFGWQKLEWIPFLLHKYFGAFLWPMFAWLFGWGVWGFFYLAGWGAQLPSWGQQLIWLLILLGVAGASHIGARQAIRQSLLFFKVGYVAFPSRPMSYGLLLFALFLPLILPGLMVWVVWMMWGTAIGVF